MKQTQSLRLLTLVVVVLGATVTFQPIRSGVSADAKVTLLHLPDGGIQPQTVLDAKGVLHLIYFRGAASAGDIEYVRRERNAEKFSQPIRVNSEPRSAVAIGTVRGPQMSIGRDGRLYVIWFGPQMKPGDPTSTMPVFFSRFNDAHTAFESQRNVMQYATGGDGGLSIAADLRGNVYAVWHATGSEPGEDHRRVYLAHSSDDGRTFSRESPVSPSELGACGCCGMRAAVDSSGTLYILYRAAAQSIHRDMTLLASTDQGRTFRTLFSAPWELNACPMSTAYLSEVGSDEVAAWGKAGQVYFQKVDFKNLTASAQIEAPGVGGKRKHPAVAGNKAGQLLLVWTEGTGWATGGSLTWQLFDNMGKPLTVNGSIPEVPAWDLPSVFADEAGNFTIAY
jgi:hypothetical protein